MPRESLEINSVTNWTIPFLVVILVLFILFISHIFFSKDVEVQKRVRYVRTKSNDFALKVSVKVKARRFVEKIRIYDKIPAMTKVHNAEGLNGKFEKERNRLKWDINYLSTGEERVFEYIIFSKIKILGKFELPSSAIVYEKNGKIHEDRSNRVFFVNEQEPDKVEKNY